MNNLKQIPKCLSFFAIPRNCNKLHKNIDVKDALKTVTCHHVTKNKGKIPGFFNVLQVIELMVSSMLGKCCTSETHPHCLTIVILSLPTEHV